MTGLAGAPFVDPFAVMNAVGLVAFALVGATKAVREGFDVFGVTVVGLVTAFAGGATRDVLVGRVPLALRSPAEVTLSLAGVALALGVIAIFESPDGHPVTLFSDAVGLAAFTTAGAIVAVRADLTGFGVVAIATINAVGGGAAADVLLDRSPFVLVEDFYATCAVLGGSVHWVVVVLGGTNGTAATACAAVAIGTRLAAIRYGWTLPTAQTLRSSP